jgi:hypothetical protein
MLPWEKDDNYQMSIRCLEGISASRAPARRASHRSEEWPPQKQRRRNDETDGNTAISILLLFCGTDRSSDSGHPDTAWADGKPDLNGFWQVLNTAIGTSSPRVETRGGGIRLGNHAIPPGLGVVEGGKTLSTVGVGQTE